MNTANPSLSPPKASKEGFTCLSSMIKQTPPAPLLKLRDLAAKLPRDKLINRFTTAFSGKKRVAALALADELILRGIPPAFWYSHLSVVVYDVNQKLDLILFDFRWLRHAHPDHIKKVRFMRYRELFTLDESAFHRAAEYVLYGGNRPPWRIVASLDLTKSQQYEMRRLQSVFIAKSQMATNLMRNDVFRALSTHMESVKRTKAFTDNEAKATVLRRHKLWLCSRMSGKRAAEIRWRYRQMTDLNVTEDIIRRQLKIVQEIMKINQITKTEKSESL